MKIIYPLLFLFVLISCNGNHVKKDRLSKTQPHPALSIEQDKSLKASKERGGLVYTDFCMQCHLANGMGIPGSFPPLARSNWLTEKRTESIRGVKYGQNGEITVNGETYNGVMAPMGLSDEEVADVMNYIMNSWGNTQDKMVSEEEVAAIEK